jgi:Flp pilus assembly protein TadG
MSKKQFPTRLARSRRRSAQQSGNAMLEAALIFLPMMAMFLALWMSLWRSTSNPL